MSRVIEARILCDRCGLEFGLALSGQQPQKPDLCERCEDAIADAVLTVDHWDSVGLLDQIVTNVERVVKRWAERRKAQEGDR